MPRDRKRRSGAARPQQQATNRPPVSIDYGAPDTARAFEVEDVAWLAWVAGQGAGGTGRTGQGMLEAVHFAPADQPERPVFEALVAQSRFQGLYDSELRLLLAQARAIPSDDAGPSTAG